MELVEYHGSDVFKKRVVVQHPQEDALGDDEDLRVGGGAAFEPHLVTNLPPERDLKFLSHATSGGSSGDATRFKHNDLPSVRDAGPPDSWRDSSCLARSRRGLQNDAAVNAQGRDEVGQHVVNRQWLKHR
jgi:hypothetical protein